MSVVVKVVAGATLGLVLQRLHEEIKKAKDRSRTTEFILDNLQTTIVSITPPVNQLDKHSKDMNDSDTKVIEDLKHLLETAVVLVKTYAELRRRDIIKKLRYKRQIKELEASLEWMANVKVQVNQWADIKAQMAKLSEMNTKLDLIMRQLIVVKEAEGSSEETAEFSSGKSKPKIDAHVHWYSRKRNKDHGIRFTWRVRE